jgi:hypothetical protein
MRGGTADFATGGTWQITVLYWAAARAAAGVATDVIEAPGPLSLGEVVSRAVALHPGTRLPDVLKVCSVLVGDQSLARNST